MLDTYQALAKTVIINKDNRLISHDNTLTLVGTGRSAFVFRIKASNKAMKLFFPAFSYIAKEEAEIYKHFKISTIIHLYMRRDQIIS